MKRLAVLVVVTGMLSVGLTTQCPLFDNVTPSDGVTVELINNGDDPVDLTVFISDDPDISRGALEATGEDIDEEIQPLEMLVLTRSCEQLQAVAVNAVLDVVGGLGPVEDSNVIRQGSNFQCGGTVTFTFDNNFLRTDLTIGVSVR